MATQERIQVLGGPPPSGPRAVAALMALGGPVGHMKLAERGSARSAARRAGSSIPFCAPEKVRPILTGSLTLGRATVSGLDVGYGVESERCRRFGLGHIQLRRQVWEFSYAVLGKPDVRGDVARRNAGSPAWVYCLDRRLAGADGKSRVRPLVTGPCRPSCGPAAAWPAPGPGLSGRRARRRGSP